MFVIDCYSFVSGHLYDNDVCDCRLSVELIRESPQAPIRYCLEIAEEYYPLVIELFNAAFISVWTALSRQAQEELIDCLMIVPLSLSRYV
jgi:FKBP12-rapamycin complex-associated protein